MTATNLQLTVRFRILSIIITLLIFTTFTFPCGAPQLLFGVVHNGILPVPAVVIVSVDGRATMVPTSSFGFYSLRVGACPELHTVTVSHRRYSFQPVTFWTDGSGTPININFVPIEPPATHSRTSTRSP